MVAAPTPERAERCPCPTRRGGGGKRVRRCSKSYSDRVLLRPGVALYSRWNSKKPARQCRTSMVQYRWTVPAGNSASRAARAARSAASLLPDDARSSRRAAAARSQTQPRPRRNSAADARGLRLSEERPVGASPPELCALWQEATRAAAPVVSRDSKCTRRSPQRGSGSAAWRALRPLWTRRLGNPKSRPGECEAPALVPCPSICSPVNHPPPPPRMHGSQHAARHLREAVLQRVEPDRRPDEAEEDPGTDEHKHGAERLRESIGGNAACFRAICAVSPAGCDVCAGGCLGMRGCRRQRRSKSVATAGGGGAHQLVGPPQDALFTRPDLPARIEDYNSTDT